VKSRVILRVEEKVTKRVNANPDSLILKR